MGSGSLTAMLFKSEKSLALKTLTARTVGCVLAIAIERLGRFELTEAECYAEIGRIRVNTAFSW